MHAGRILPIFILTFALAVSRGWAAEREVWWAYQPLQKPPVPRLASNSSTNPIDAFVRFKLSGTGLAPSSEADRRTLLRRVSYDLTGLPPSPEEVSAFLGDASPGAYEREVERLLGSPRHGERWARHWMDAAHFAETHGHDQDRIRTNAWPYRDYLIASFNADKPYSRFLQEQVAGDVLFPESPEATVALGFIASGSWDESSLRDIREDTIDRQIARYIDRDDMVTTVMQTFTSTTVQCARCHDHKFDPVSQSDYYALQAVFAGVDRANRTFDTAPSVHQRRQELFAERRRVERGERALLLSAKAGEEVAEWQRTNAGRVPDWRTIEAQTFVTAGGTVLTRQGDGSLLASGPRPERDTYTVTALAGSRPVTAVQLEVLPDESLPKKGPGRQDNGNLHLSEFQLLLFEPGAAAAREIPFSKVAADFNQPGWAIEQALDRNEKTAWGIFPKVGEAHRAVFELKEPLHPAPGATLAFVLKQLHGEGHLIGRFRLALTDAAPPVRTAPLPAEVSASLAVQAADRTEEQRAALAAFVLKERIAIDLAALPKPSLVYAAASEFEPDGSLKPSGTPRPVRVLKRGEIGKPGELAEPGTLSCVPGLPFRFALPAPDDEGARRAALARWLSARENPLTWRSIVNRVWHLHFGRGLVDTPNDFGRMAATPSHPELLDWLAVWFRDEAHGSLKELHRLIVTSATYRQSSAGGRQGEESDPENRLLWRMNRSRLDSDQVRDAVLQIAGCLDLRMGGPSDMQFDLKPGIHVTPKVDYSKFDVGSAAGRRRSVYRFLFRTLPDPFMDALDCPAGDQLTPVRSAAVTVQQALAMWNNAFVVRYAEEFATRLASGENPFPQLVALACELVWSRPPTDAEQGELASYAAKHGLPNLCRLLFNSNEFMFVN